MKNFTKKNFLYLVLAVFTFFTSNAQDLNINGSCVIGTSTMVFGGDAGATYYNGMPVYYNGTLDLNYQSAIVTAQAYLYYALASELSTPENRWVVSYDGQPYYYFISDAMTAPTGEYLPFDTMASATDCGGSVFITVPCVMPTTPIVTASSSTVCSGNTATLTINGTLNDATNWVIYSSSCGGTLVGTTTSSTFDVTPLSPNTTYYVRGEGGCVTPSSCGSVAIDVITPLGNTLLTAIEVSGLSYSTTGNNLASNCYTNTIGSAAPDVWYKVNLESCVGLLSLNTCTGTNYDSRLRVYAEDGVTELANNDDYCGLQSSINNLNVISHSFVYVIVEGYNNDSGNYGLSITQTVVTNATFNTIAPVCSSVINSHLPTTSLEGYTGTWSPAFNNSTATEYTFTPDSSCLSPVLVTVDVIPAAGDSSVFGNNEWNVYVWNSGGNYSWDNPWTNNYSGYYTASGVDFNTQNQWNGNGSPSDALGYQGCPVNVDYHSWIAKRQGFPSGDYTINIDSHDDSSQLWVNGVMVWQHDGCCDSHANVWQGYLGALDQVEFRTTEGVGFSNGQISFVPVPLGITNVQPSQCGVTLAAYNSIVYANLVPFAQAYRFRVIHLGTNQVILKDYLLRNLYLSSLPFFQYNQGYSIEVAVKRNNVWEAFGSPCTVTTASPTTQIRVADCNGTFAKNAIIYADVVSAVLGYRFKVVNTVTNSVQFIDSSLRNLYLYNIVDYNPLGANYYLVSVAVKNTDGNYLSFGSECPIQIGTSVAPPIAKTIVSSEDFKAMAYPNPFANDFKLEVKTSSMAVLEISIYDMIGKLIEVRKVNLSDIETYTIGDNFPSGVYNVIVTQAENTQTVRVIKR